jgi:Copper chaperone
MNTTAAAAAPSRRAKTSAAAAIAALAVLAAISLSAAGCRVKDVKTAEISAPAVRNAACESIVDAALKKLPGKEFLAIKSLDYSTGKIVVQYDSMKVGVRNLEEAIASAGFAAGPFPADKAAEAKLPPECRAP